MAGKNISSLSIGLFGDVSHFAKAFGGSAVNSVKTFAGSITSAGGTLLSFTGIGAAVATGFEAVKHIGDGFKMAANLEKTQIQFAALIGDADKAANKIADLTEFAKNTPFEMPALIDTSRQLLAFGVTNEKLLPTLKAIGDVAAGVGQPLEEVTAIFGRVAEEGTLSERSLRQFAKAGIPVVEELAKQFHVSKTQIKDLATSGQIGFGDLQKAFASMTGPAGKFQGQMEQQAGSLGGLWTRLSGSVEEGLGRVAQSLLESFNIKGGISTLTNGLLTAGAYIGGFIERIAPTVNRIGSTIAGGFMAAYNYVAPIVANISTVVVRTFGMIEDAVGPILTGLWGTVQSVWGTIYNFVAPIVSSIYQAVASNWETILQTVTTASIAVWDVTSAVWGVIAAAATRIWEAVVSVWQWGSELITGHSVTAGSAITTAWDGIGAAARWLSDAMSLAFNVAAYAIKHFDDGVAIVALEVAAFFTDIGDRAAYVFGDVIPYALGYVARNWKEIFTDLYNFQNAIMQNLGSNVVSVFKSLPGLIAGTTQWGDVWKPLTEGFKSQIKETFKIPEFANSQLTKSLTDQAGRLESAYGQGLGKFLASKEEQAKSTSKSASDWIKKALGFGDKPVVPKIEAPPAVPVKAVPTLTSDSLALSIKPEIKHGDLVRFNSAESQLLRFEAGFNVKGPTASKATVTASYNPKPPPHPADAENKDHSKESERENAEAKQTDYLFKIWQNTTPGNQTLQQAVFA